MKQAHVIAAGSSTIATLLVIFAFYAGPPPSVAPWHPRPVLSKVPQPVLRLSPVTVNGSGLVPDCGDDAAQAIVVRVLRLGTADRVLGLSSNRTTGYSAAGPGTQRDCQARVEQGGKERWITYRINGAPSRGNHDWDLTVGG
jgi:hypothetical protein